MFDGILKNMATDLIRTGLIGLAGYLNADGFKFDTATFVADGLAAFSVFWMWYENRGHQQIVDLFKHSTQTGNLAIAKSVAANSTFHGFIGILALASCLSIFGQGEARAQLVTKAPPLPLAQSCLQVCNVWFIGGGVGGAGSNLDIIGGGLDNSVFANGGMAFVNAGAMYASGKLFLKADIGGGYLFGPPATVNAVAASESGIIGFAFAEAGGNLAGLLGTAAPISTNSAILQDLISLYAGVGPVIQNGMQSWGTVAGGTYAMGPVLLDMKYIYANQQSAITNANAKNLQLVLVGVDVPFKW